MNKRVLMIAPGFYPCQLVGAHRSGKFCKYLVDFGYDATVITVDPRKAGWPTDDCLIRQLPQSLRRVVTYYPFSESFKEAGRKTMRLVGKLLGRTSAKQAVLSEAVSNPPPTQRLERWLAVPGKDVYWIPFALSAAIAEARRADIVYATGGPWASLILGYLVKRFTGKKLVVDLRDPWTFNRIQVFPTRFHNRLDAWMEGHVLRSADAIISVTEPLVRQYREHYPDIRPDRFVLITNGYDPDDIVDITPSPTKTGKVRIGYFGTVYAGRDPGLLFRAARWAVDQGKIAPGCLEFVFFGRSGPEVANAAIAAGAEEMVRVIDSIPYAEALREMAACDALLVLGSRETDSISLPAKIFEYMGLRKPVLVVSGDGALKEFLREHRFGLQVGLDDEAAARNVLMQLYKDVLSGRTDKYLFAEPERFSRRELTGQLAVIFDRLLK